MIASTLSIGAVAANLSAVDPGMVAKVNANPSSTWRAGIGKGRFSEVSLADASGLLGARRASAEQRRSRSAADVLEDATLPSSFDMRKQYGHCASVSAIYDQGHCGGCWAFAVAESLGDRFCMRGKDVVVSPQDLLACDHTGHDNGCQGGLCEDAFDYISDNGILSAQCAPWTGNETVCTSDTCSVSGAESKRYYSSWAQYIDSNETKIKQELFQRGSIAASFEVFHDFYAYTSGVYAHLEGDYQGLHAVNLMGWGTDAGVDYWLVKNSWGPTFGENGFFRIKRGLKENGCDFEGSLTAASPTLFQSVVV